MNRPLTTRPAVAKLPKILALGGAIMGFAEFDLAAGGKIAVQTATVVEVEPIADRHETRITILLTGQRIVAGDFAAVLNKLREAEKRE